MPKIAIFHPTDPVGHVPGGIDTIIRGIVKWAPEDLDYTVFGATSDVHARPVLQQVALPFGNGRARLVPLTTIDPTSKRSRIPVTARYLWSLIRQKRRGLCRDYAVLDFHRMESIWLFRKDPRPKNVTIHQDMSIIRDPDCDIMWRHAPWLYESLESQALHGAARVFTVRRTAVTRYCASYPDLASRIGFFPTWVDTDNFQPATDESSRSDERARWRATRGLAADAPVFVFVGRLDHQKDPLLALEAFRNVRRQHPTAHLVLVGDGDLRPEVERLSETPGLAGGVTLTGAIPPQQIAAVLRAADLFLMSSAYEGMPIAVLEALATGVPVISTRVGELDLVVHEGVSGYIAAERTPEALAAVMQAGLVSASAMAGAPCLEAVRPYRAQEVLRAVYANHRAQAAAAR